MPPDINDSDPEAYYVTTLERRLVREPRPSLGGPEDLYRLIAPWVAHADREFFFGVYLSTKNHVLGVETISVGSLSASLVHPREVFKPALVYSAGAIAVAHNHPSGDPDPSPEDRAFTRRLAQAGEFLGIRVLDHVILGAHGDFVSLKAHGDL